VYIVFVPYSSSYTFFLTSSPTSHWYQTPDRTCVTLLFSNFVKKNYIFVCSRISLWHFLVYLYYNLNCFIFSISLISTLVSFLRDINRF
jgi:hypothetical protein